MEVTNLLVMIESPSVLADGGNGWGHMGGWGWGMAIFGWLFMTAVVVLGVWLIWSTTRQQPRRHAADLLDERYARGELDRDEYLERKADLEQ